MTVRVTDDRFTRHALPRHFEEWREPDVIGNSGRWAVWYGPGGEGGDCATEVEFLDERTWRVSEYQCAVGLVEDLDDDTPFIRQSTTVRARNARHAAAVGVEVLGYWGGTEEWADALP